tara:strand:- start:34 stop:243 length:210 start_codon:yes stop_codon:yes gene_type:complete
MTQEFRVVYKDSDKSIVSLLDSDLDYEDHESRCADGVKVASQILTWDDDNYLVMPTDVQVSPEGLASKV